MKSFALALFLLLAPIRVFAWESDLRIPDRAAPVVDEAGLLQTTDVDYLEKLLRRLKERSGVEVSVFIPASLQDRTIEDFSIAVAEKWKLGKKKEDKGLLFVIAPRERKMRLEVGYGLEGEITDAFSRRVLDDIARPYFRRGEYAQGIYASLLAIQRKANLGLQAADEPEPAERSGFVVSPLIILLLILAIFGLRIFLFFFGGGGGGGTYIRRGGWGSMGGPWSGGGSGGGSWGGGGGGFGGGGSSSSW